MYDELQKAIDEYMMYTKHMIDSEFAALMCEVKRTCGDKPELINYVRSTRNRVNAILKERTEQEFTQMKKAVDDFADRVHAIMTEQDI